MAAADSQSLPRDISRAIVRLTHEYTGRGPTKAHTTISGGSVMILLADTLTRGEHRLVAAGKGDLDYDLYLKHLSEAGYGGPLVLHGLTEKQVAGSLGFLREKLARAALGRAGTVGEAGR